MKQNKKKILITGSASGLGKDTAFELARKGHKVFATVHRDESVKKLASEAKKKNLELVVFKLDILKKEDRKKIDDLDIDVLINNAGIGESGSLAEIDIKRIKKNFETNLFATLELSQRVLKKMIKKDKGTVIFISSLAGKVVMPFLGSYSMSKFALSAGVKSLDLELSFLKKKVWVSVIEPGAYRTGFNQKNIQKKYKWMDKNSYFYKIKDKIRDWENKYFDTFEKRSNKSIVKKIVKAAESNKPRSYYSAPFSQVFMVWIIRFLGFWKNY